ncbi:MAG TPA: ATP-binding protein [Candidatus Limnocylindrales bacterium]|nr:ATP-binding protein [Candidatus Limnocylindrales bacterium]
MTLPMGVAASRIGALGSRVRSAVGGLRVHLPGHSLPIRARIALFGAGVVALTVLIFGILVYKLVEGSLLQQQDATLKARGQQITALIVRRGFIPRGGPGFSPDLSTADDTFYEVISGNQIISTNASLDNAPVAIPSDVLDAATSPLGSTTTMQLRSDLPLRVFTQPWSRPDLGVSGYVVTFRSLTAITNQLATLRLFLLIGALLSLFGALAASWLLAGRALRPLETMARTAEEIGQTQDLSRRLPAQPTGDEVGRLQQSFNLMLQQLEDAYRRLQGALAAQRRFVADASHELRTPLTTIRGNVGLLLKRDDITTEDRAAALQDIAGESERMSRMVQDLLTLARADAGQHLDKAPLDLAPIVREVSRQAQTVAEQRDVQLEEARDVRVVGNADALKQLLWILVDNAVKNTPDGGHVRLRLDQENGFIALSVRDDGSGIPAGDTERIFERFYQADASRAGEGTGLGLAIARWIVKEHGGRVQATNNPDRGATFRVEIPVAKS